MRATVAPVAVSAPAGVFNAILVATSPSGFVGLMNPRMPATGSAPPPTTTAYNRHILTADKPLGLPPGMYVR